LYWREAHGGAGGLAVAAARPSPRLPPSLPHSPPGAQSARDEYAAWWESKQSKWVGQATNRRNAPTSFRLPAVPASAASDAAGWLRHLVRSTFIELLIRGPELDAEALRTAHGRDAGLASAEAACRKLSDVALGVPRLPAASNAAVETAVRVATGSVPGPAERFVASCMLAADSPADTAASASRMLASALSALRRTAAIRRKRHRETASLTAAQHKAATAQTQLDALQQSRLLSAACSFLRHMARTMMLEDALASKAALEATSKALGDPSAAAAQAPVEMDEPVERDADPLTRSFRWHQAQGIAVGDNKRLMKAFATAQANGHDQDTSKQVVRILHILELSIRAVAKSRNVCLADAADWAATKMLNNDVEQNAHQLVVNAAQLLPFLVCGESKRVVSWEDAATGLHLAMPPPDLLLASLGRPEAAPVDEDDVTNELTEAMSASSAVLCGDDTAMGLLLAAERGVPGARDAARRAALASSSAAALSTQMATLAHREVTRPDHQAASDSRNLGEVIAVVEELRQQRAKDADAARTTFLEEQSKAKHALEEAAARAAALMDAARRTTGPEAAVAAARRADESAERKRSAAKRQRESEDGGDPAKRTRLA